MELNPNGFGKIEYINSKFNTDRFQDLQTQTFVDVNSSPIDIGGWGPNRFKRECQAGTDDQTQIIAGFQKFI